MNTPKQSLPRTQVPGKPSRRLADFSKADTIVGLSLGAVLVVVGTLYGSLVGVLAMVFSIICMWRWSYGRTYWVLGQGCKNLWIRYARKGVLWRAMPENAFLQKRRKKRRKPPIPLGIRKLTTPSRNLGMIYNPERYNDSVVITGSGSDIAGGDFAAQDRGVSDIADVVRRGASVPHLSTGTSWVFRKRPPNVGEVEKYFRDNLHHGVLHPEVTSLNNGDNPANQIEVDERLHNYAEELLEMAGSNTASPTMAAVVSVTQSGAFNTKKRKNLVEADINRENIVRVAESMSDGLSNCGVKDVATLNSGQIWAYMHNAWSLKQPLLSEQATNTSQSPWPQSEIRVSRDRIYTDGVEHAILRITGCPESVLPHFFRQLHAVPGWTAVTLCGEMVSTTKDNFLLSRAVPLFGAFHEMLGTRYRTPKEERLEGRLRQRHQELFDSGFSQLYNIFLCVSGKEGSQEVSDGIAEFESVGRRMSLKLQLIRGECRLLPALFSATTGINLM